jgi:hypothetical protein
VHKEEMKKFKFYFLSILKKTPVLYSNF